MKKALIIGLWVSIMFVYTSFTSVEKPAEPKKTRCIGYTVIDAHTVELCDGTIEKRDWQIRIGKE